MGADELGRARGPRRRIVGPQTDLRDGRGGADGSPTAAVPDPGTADSAFASAVNVLVSVPGPRIPVAAGHSRVHER